MTEKAEKVPVSLTEEFVLNTSVVNPKLSGWRYYRVEYGGCNEDCFKECPIWLPPRADAFVLDLLFDLWQAKTGRGKRHVMHEIVKELERYVYADERKADA